MNSSISGLTELFFSAFEKRPIPEDGFISPTYGDPQLEPLLRRVDRRDITQDFVDEMNLHLDDWIAFMTNEGRLHYLPVVMSLSLQDLHGTDDRYATLDVSILSMLLPWYFYASPHEWVKFIRWNRESSSHGLANTYRSLFDEEFYFSHGGGNLLLSLELQERRALKVYVENHPEHSFLYPLHVYGAYEVLDGRIEVGDGYSWLPRHEKIAVVDFIDYLTTDCRDMLSDEDIKRMLDFRQTIKLD